MQRSAPALVTVLLLLGGCAAVRDGRDGRGSSQRMAQPPSVAGVAEESFGRPAWGRQGEFTLSGQRVRYERGAEKLALFEPLPSDVKTPLRFHVGDSATTCEGWTPEQSANGRLVGGKPWVLSCKWGAAPAAMLQIGEGQMRRGKLSREGAYRRGELTLGLRSVHLLEGSAQPQTTAVGYEMLHQGTVVGSLDLSGAQPRLRRPDPATPVGRAVTEAALALALVSEPG
jgi:hypothetical protein